MMDEGPVSLALTHMEFCTYLSMVLTCLHGKEEHLLHFFFFLTTVRSCPLPIFLLGYSSSLFLGTLQMSQRLNCKYFLPACHVSFGLA